MENFEEKFLEELAKARARLEGKESYDDESIEKEFIPDEEPVKKENNAKKVSKPKKEVRTETKKTNESSTQPVIEVKKETPEKKIAKKSVNTEKAAIAAGCVAVAVSFVLSCLSLLVKIDSDAWKIFDAYMPFIGIVAGAVSVIWGASLIKKNKKGTFPIVLGLLAMLISVLVPAIII